MSKPQIAGNSILVISYNQQKRQTQFKRLDENEKDKIVESDKYTLKLNLHIWRYQMCQLPFSFKYIVNILIYL